MKRPYKPRINSFLYKTMEYLYENGASPAWKIRQDIGLNDWCKKSMYPDRSSYYFGCVIVPRLLNKGIIEKVKHGWYRLVPSLKANLLTDEWYKG